MHTSSVPTAHPDRFARLALLGNAAFSGLAGLALLAAPSAIAGFLGAASAVLLASIGAGLLIYAATLVRAGRRPELRASDLKAFIAGDLVWVAGSAVLLLGFPDTLGSAGQWTVGVVADIVLAFAVLQWIGLRRLGHATSPA